MSMSNEDVVKLVQLMLTADGGCSYCATALIERAMSAFPHVDWVSALREAKPDFRYTDLKPYGEDWRST